MSDINFDCPKCGQNLDAPPNLAGLFIECPACGAIIKVPPTSADSPSAPPAVPRAPPPQEAKDSTMRIDLPAEFRVPPPAPRRFVIKRPRS